MAGNEKSSFLIGDISSIRVHFPASYLSLPGRVVSDSFEIGCSDPHFFFYIWNVPSSPSFVWGNVQRNSSTIPSGKLT